MNPEWIEPLFLSRLQFALTIMFHILFPTLTIGLGLYLVIVESLWLRTRQEIYYRMCRFWARVFAINFGVGVVTGIVMEFEFGTNWSRFSTIAANVFSPMLYYEVMTAFFLEAGFLGIMLFGWGRVRPALHFASTCMVSGGAILSAFWIMAGNSWMQTPGGFRLLEGRFMVTSFREVIFSDSFLTSLSHMIIASFETSFFAVAGISAFFLLRRRDEAFYRRSMSVALLAAALLAPLQIYLGDSLGRRVAVNQPAKLAAIEAHWETNTNGGAALNLLAIPDMRGERNYLELSIPGALSVLVTHSLTGRIPGLKEFPRDLRPNSLVIFWTFRIMAGIGFLFLFVMAWAAVLWKQGRLYGSRPFLWTLVAVQPLGWLAVETGWITTETGRQPWLVYNVLRTSESVSPVPAAGIIWSLSLFFVIFIAIGSSYWYYVFKILRAGPDLESPIPPVQRSIIQRISKKRNRSDDSH